MNVEHAGRRQQIKIFVVTNVVISIEERSNGQLKKNCWNYLKQNQESKLERCIKQNKKY